MLTVHGDEHRFCDGLSRRQFLQAGGLGFAGLTLADVLRAQATAGVTGRPKSVIMVCLNGGPSHIDMYDMKPDAPVEFRGEWRPIATNVPGIDICELMPLQASIADKFALVRSLQMIEPSHQLHECYTAYPTNAARPSFGSIVSASRGRHPAGLPNYVSLSLSDHPRNVEIAERPTYLGLAHAPFEPSPDSLANLNPLEEISASRLNDRRALLRTFDGMRRDLDVRGVLAGQDAFAGQALDILTSSRVRDAFDISQEPEAIQRMYGPDQKLTYNHQFGHTFRSTAFLRARRLVEAGVPVVTLAPSAWDDHGNLNGVRGTIFERSGERLPLLDRSIHALITDLYQRGLDQDVLVLMWGEFGRTPRVNKYGGRDHWTPANFAFFAGGGLPTGQMIGTTDATASRVTSKPYNAQNVMSVVYRHLGIDASQTFLNFAGRPMYILEDRQGIRELA